MEQDTESPRIAALTLDAAREDLASVRAFYGTTLGLPAAGTDTFVVGDARLGFRAAAPSRRPFHHVALLVPGDRFEAAHAWAAERTELLRFHDEPVVHFDAWDADAVYFHDPAGSIVELIAHRALGATGATGPFAAPELLGISEVGLVLADRAGAAHVLERDLGVGIFSGDAAADDLAFAGRQGHALILTPPGRGWLPTGRRAERHAAEVVLEGTPHAGRVELPDGIVIAAR